MVIAINPHKKLGDQGHAACGALADFLQIFPVTRVCDMGTLSSAPPVFVTWGPLCRHPCL